MSEKIYIQRPLTATIFKNKNPKSDKSPEYTGTAKTETNEYYINCWVKTNKKGEKYFTCSLKPKKPVYSESQKPPKKEDSFDPDFTDEIPF